MALEAIEVGKKFPLRIPRGQEGLFPMLADESVIIPIYLSSCSSATAHKFANSPLCIGATEEENIPFFLIELAKWGTLDGYMNPWMYDEEYRQNFVESDSNMIHLVVVEGQQTIVRAQRMLGVEPSIMKFVREAYQRCIDHYDSGIDVNRNVRQIYQELPTPDEMLDATDHKQIFR